MIGYDSVAIVDWNSGNDTGPTPRKDAIWIGAVLGGVAQEPAYLRNRVLALDYITHLIESEINAGRKLMIGVDFPLAYPQGFVDAVIGTNAPLRLWDYYREHLQDRPNSNNRFELAGALNAQFPGQGPFWFNAKKADVPHLPRTKPTNPIHGLREKRAVETKAKGTFTCWQMGGAGAVGGQAMIGMAALAKLRARLPGKINVWPFEWRETQVLLVEIWPSLIADTVQAAGDTIKDRAQVRLLAQAFAGLPPTVFHTMLDVDEPDEGWILGVGFKDELARYACQS